VTPRQHALRVAAQEALLDAVSAEYEKIRAEAEAAFAAMLTEDGSDRVAVLLPDGEKLDRITVKAPPPSVEMDGGTSSALLEWCQDHFPAAIEDFIDPAATGSTDVVEAVRAKVPEVIRQRVRPGTVKVLLKEIEDSGGFLADRRTNEPEQVATVTPGTVTGAFSFTGNNAKARRARIMAELLAGRLQGVIGFGPLALPAPEGDAEAGDCPGEAVFGDGRVPCVLPKGHAPPHKYGDTLLPFDDDGEVAL
jgi:hypothetical protein